MLTPYFCYPENWDQEILEVISPNKSLDELNQTAEGLYIKNKLIANLEQLWKNTCQLCKKMYPNHEIEEETFTYEEFDKHERKEKENNHESIGKQTPVNSYVGNPLLSKTFREQIKEIWESAFKK